ncbi:hypothetical protein E2C01_066152 [Portunus trituberculatus]|uniref:Uncharacterized protein n=1 Tax=Portunus trituberculatus TaxID=210409 RepID=A0A5B7HGC0_PORTR|nr:hypothetical protein [Portunus trituberculatus]
MTSVGNLLDTHDENAPLNTNYNSGSSLSSWLLRSGKEITHAPPATPPPHPRAPLLHSVDSALQQQAPRPVGPPPGSSQGLVGTYRGVASQLAAARGTHPPEVCGVRHVPTHLLVDREQQIAHPAHLGPRLAASPPRPARQAVRRLTPTSGSTTASSAPTDIYPRDLL